MKTIMKAFKAVKHSVVAVVMAVVAMVAVAAPAKATIIDDLVAAADLTGLSTAVSTILVGMIAFSVAFLAYALITKGVHAGKRA